MHSTKHDQSNRDLPPPDRCPADEENASLNDLITSKRMARRIAFRANRLAAKFGLCRSDADDLSQDFYLALHLALGDSDSDESDLRQTVTGVLNNRYKHHVRELAQRYEMDVVSLESLSSEESGEEDGEPPVYDDQAEQMVERFDLSTDIQTVLSQLPDSLRVTAEGLMIYTPGEQAVREGVPHSTILRRLEQLRHVFEETDLSPF